MKDTENIIQKFRQKFKHSQFINYSTIELWLEEQIPLIKAEAVREVLSKIDPFDLVEDCEPDCTPERHAYHQGTWSAHLKLGKILKELNPKTQDSDKVRAERLLKLNLEKQLRCGDGGENNTISHSVNCECERIDRELNKTQDSEAEDNLDVEIPPIREITYTMKVEKIQDSEAGAKENIDCPDCQKLEVSKGIACLRHQV